MRKRFHSSRRGSKRHGRRSKPVRAFVSRGGYRQ